MGATRSGITRWRIQARSPGKEGSNSATNMALARMNNDVDILAEAQDLATELRLDTKERQSTASSASKGEYVPLNWRPNQGGHRPNQGTLRLLQEAGGHAAILQFTTLFYKKAFADPHLDQFIREHADPHGERFADWICEKFGAGQPWTQERATRKVCPFHSHGHKLQTPHDRSSAHFAAWHSPKRDPDKFGAHFKLDDCRVWMRIHFWAMREAGIFESSPEFSEYYIKFIGHFVSVYERSATMFARESARWSADPANIEKYVASGNLMEGVIGVGLNQAVKQLPTRERDNEWPYEL